MLYLDFPVPVTVDEQNARLIVHRLVKGLVHVDHEGCDCCPHTFEGEEVERMSVDEMNRILRNGVH